MMAKARAALALAAIVACGGPDDERDDAAVSGDAAPLDASAPTPDATPTPDARLLDDGAPMPDAPVPDAAADATPPDAGPPDAASPDAAPGSPDAAPRDAAPPDAAPPDAAPPDAAPPDAASPDAGPDGCDAPVPLGGSGTYVADTAGLPDFHTGSCQATAGPELVYELVLTETSDVSIDTEGSDYDTALYVRALDCATGAEIECSEDAGGGPHAQLLLPALTAGTYYVFADGGSGGGDLELHLTVTPVGIGPTIPTTEDPLIRMPGTQPADGVAIGSSKSCLNCHADYDAAIEPGHNWKGSMMAQAARDPLFWATFVVALQDSIWALGTPNAGDLCLRCHMPAGWLGGRSDPPNAAAMTGSDFDGVDCAFCHRLYDPFFDATFDGTREGSDWVGYWDETDASATPSSTAAAATYAADAVEAATASLFNGTALFDGAWAPVNAGWIEATGGQFFAAADPTRRASFADPGSPHGFFYSRYHKSRYFCGACHDVSNPVLANLGYEGTAPGDGTTVLPSEQSPAAAYFHVERTFSEFMLSDYGLPGGAAGTGPFAPGAFETSLASDWIARCQDCHMPDGVGRGCDKTAGVVRPTESAEHPESGQPVHDMTGGNAWIPWLLASTVVGSPNYDAVNAALLQQGAAVLTLDFGYGEPLDDAALLAASSRAIATLQRAASITDASYDPGTGALSFRVRNHTAHKLPSGYPEGRRVWVNVRVYAGATLLSEINPYDGAAGTLAGLSSPSSPPLAAGETHADELVYEAKLGSTLTGEDRTFHFVLATQRYKDNRIPPRGFRKDEAAARLSQPVWGGAPDVGYFSDAEYAGGWHDVALAVPTGGDRVELRLYYQTTSREYVEFLRDEIDGVGATLASPTPSGRALAYIAQTDPYFDALAAWGATIWDLWLRNKDVPGAAPILMTETVIP